MTINRGSEWRKWDLHIHSPKTHSTSNRYNDLSIADFCKEIITKNIDVIGLTNYFFITEEEYNEIVKELDDKCYVIPNFEFRASDKNTKGDHINFHILFNPKLGIRNILNSLGNVKLHNHSNKYCREADILQLGIDAITIDFETILNQLKTDFKIIEDFIVCVPYTGYGGFKVDNKPRNISQEKKFDELSHFILGNNSSKEYFNGTREYTLGKDTFIIDKNKAIINCSDAHSKEDISNKFTWIKAQPTFEGLIQILHEPNQRVSIQKDKPDQKDDKLVITEVTFTSEKNLFVDDTIHFNDNLNVIIGGKSSGKSILLYHIAKALYKDRSNESVLKYYDTTDNKYKFFYDDLQNEFPFSLNVKLASGLEQSSNRSDSETSILPEIKYIPQNHLSNLVDRSRKNGSTLKELIKELIIENDDKDTFKIFDAKINTNNIEISKDIDGFFDIKDKINSLKKDLQDKGSKDILTTSIKSKKDEILDLQKDISEENKTSYNQYNEEIQKLNEENKKIFSDYSTLNTINQKIKSSLDKLLLEKNDLLKTLENEKIKAEFEPKYNFIQNSIDELSQIENLLLLNENKNLINESSIKSQLSANNQKKAELQEKLKPLLGQIESQDKIEKLQSNIQEENEKLDYIISIENQIAQLATELVTQKEKIFSRIEDNYNQYQKVIIDLEPITQNIEQKDNDEIDIVGSTKFNFKKFKESIDNVTDLRKLKAQNPFKYLYDNNLNNLSTIDKNKIIEDLKNIFDIIHQGRFPLIKDFSNKEACRILLKNHFFDHWEVKSGSDTIHNMSTGKASFVLLKLIIKLSKSEAPILIDQPEDNLDNRSISTELVNYLRDKKLSRQIILVTHNANIVVNADAENIIIANQKDENNKNDLSIYKFDYINGSLEETTPKIKTQIRFLDSMGIREHIAEIVEGGKEAFKKREEKYGF